MSAVVAVIATYRRAQELRRLLGSLEKSTHPLRGAVVVDNADDPATADAIAASTLEAQRIVPGANLGCGGGLALGEQLALAHFPDATHLWILDDDAVVAPGALGILLAALDAEHAVVASPLIVAADGALGWFPGLTDAEKFRIIREPQTPAEFIARCGTAPVPFSWSTGVALLVTRRAIETLGFHRTDYWVRGEDLEFSLRLTHRERGVFVPTALVEHLPPPSTPAAREEEYVKHRAMIQNIAYTALRLPHGRRIARTIPGNCRRFLRTWGWWNPRILADTIAALWRGAILARPAGAKP